MCGWDLWKGFADKICSAMHILGVTFMDKLYNRDSWFVLGNWRIGGPFVAGIRDMTVGQNHQQEF